jgi:cytochrome c oxidase cbb3-type subunit 3
VSDFNSDFWSIYIAAITVVSILACAILLWSLSRRRVAVGKTTDVTGHVWDEDLEEYNNPLPRWWIWLFYLTILFGVAYLALYPGLGSYSGLLKWSSHGEVDTDQARATQLYGPIYAKYAAMPIPEVARDAQAREMGQRLFLNHCAQCHASDARGGKGYPDLTDKDWLYGGDPATIVATITNGRNAMMPAWGKIIGDQGTRDVAQYVIALSGGASDELRAAYGKDIFATNCVACHGPEGKGNPALGAPNLTDRIWLYGGSSNALIETIGKGRNGVMPAWGEFLGAEKIHLLAAYVWGLSNAN